MNLFDDAPEGALPYFDPDPVGAALVAALALAKNRRYPVFPLNCSKKPTTNNGHLDASIDPDRIATMWRLRPGPLVGVATGEVSGIDLLDIDVDHPTAVAWFAAASKRIPPTRQYGTRRGGHHLHFQHANGVRNSQSKLAKGVDTRGDGGYLVHWFSSGTACEDHSPPAPWPAWLLECVLWKPLEQTPLAGRGVRLERPEHADRAIEGALRIVSGAREGTRNGALFWASCRLRERSAVGHIGHAEAQTLLTAAARTAGLADVEAKRTIASAWEARS